MASPRASSSWPLIALGGAAALLLLSKAAKAARPAASFTFPYKDRLLLAPGQTDGGSAYVPANDGSAMPLFVWLHGNNADAVLHKDVNGAGAFDVRDLVPDEYVVAAPSQTNSEAASAPPLWQYFDLDSFVDATELAIGQPIDRSRIVLAGHSGAGCNSAGGLLAKLKYTYPARILAIDTCLNAAYGARFAALGVPVSAYYQTNQWVRDPAGFASAFVGKGAVADENTFMKLDADHSSIVPMALARAFG